MDLQPQECAQRQPDVVALRFRRAALASFDSGTLFDAAMVMLDGPTEFGELQPGQFVHAQVVGGPVRNVAVWGDYPEYLHQPITLQPNFGPPCLDGGLTQRPQALLITIDQPIGFQSGQPLPIERPDQFQIVQTSIPAIEEDTARRKAPRSGRLQHLGEMIVLGLSVGFVVNAIVTGQMAVSIGPDQRDQVDALNDGVMLAGPVARDQFHRASVRFIERRIIDHEHPVVAADLGLGFLPKSLGVGFAALQESGKGIVSGRVELHGLHAGGLRGAVDARTRNEEIDVVIRLNFAFAHEPTIHRDLRWRKLPKLPTA